VNYGELISEAFRITWRNRFLWVFGFFAAGSSFNIPSGGGTGGGTDDNDFDPNSFDFAGSLAFGAGPGPDTVLGPMLAQQFPSGAMLAALVVLGLLVALFFIAAAIISNGALAESVAAIHRGERRGFGSAFGAGWRNFWRVLLQGILLFLIALGLLLAIGLPVGLAIFGVFAGTESVGARVAVTVIAVLVAILLLLLVFVPLYIVSQFALREMVVGRAGIAGAIGRGFRLFRRNTGRSLLVWLIWLALAIATGIALLILLVVLGLVLVGPGLYLFFSETSATAGVIVGVIGGLILLALYLILSGAVGTFSHAYWTLAYLRLAEPPATPAAVGPSPGYGPEGGTATL